MELKNLPVRKEIHIRLKNEADKRDLKLRGLTERILLKWLNDQKIFAQDITSSNK